MENSNNGRQGSGMKWTIGIFVVIFAALFTLAIVFDWFGWRDGEPKERIEPITPEMVADQEVAPNATVEEIPGGALVEKIPSVREEDGAVIVPGNPKIHQLMNGAIELIDEDGQKTVKFNQPMTLDLNGSVLNVQPGDVITNAKLKGYRLESGIYKPINGGAEIPLNGLNIDLK